MNNPEYNITRDKITLAVARFVAAPAIAFHPKDMVTYVFPCLREDENTHEPGRWATKEEEEEVILWCAQGLDIMLAGEFTNLHVIVDGDLAQGGRPVGVSAFSWEYGSEADGDVSAADLALDGFEAGKWTKEMLQMPSALEVRNWLRMAKWMNKLRDGVYRRLGDVFVGRESTPFPSGEP